MSVEQPGIFKNQPLFKTKEGGLCQFYELKISSCMLISLPLDLIRSLHDLFGGVCLKNLSIFFALFIAFALAGCVGPDVQYIRSGILKKGMHVRAFEKEWGLPEKTIPCDGKAIQGINHYTGDVVKFTSDLECWEYTRYGVTLMLSENVLVGWQTDKTAKELKSISEQIAK